MAGVLDHPPRGGLREEIGGQVHNLILTMGLIEEFEDAHRGVLGVFEDCMTAGRSPTAREITDLIILGLVGAGMERQAAGDLVQAELPAGLRRYFTVAQALIGVAVEPDIWDGVEDEDDEDEEADEGAPGKPVTGASASDASLQT